MRHTVESTDELEMKLDRFVRKSRSVLLDDLFRGSMPCDDRDPEFEGDVLYVTKEGRPRWTLFVPEGWKP